MIKVKVRVITMSAATAVIARERGREGKKMILTGL